MIVKLWYHSSATFQMGPPPSLSQFPTWIHLGLRLHTWDQNVIWVRCCQSASALFLHGHTAHRGEPTFFNDYQSAATHYLRSIHRNKSTRGIKAVTVQLITRPQHQRCAWRLAPPIRPIPGQPSRCHDIGCNIPKSTISYGYDILSYWYQRA